jgi:hypothetical protein
MADAFQSAILDLNSLEFYRVKQPSAICRNPSRLLWRGLYDISQDGVWGRSIFNALLVDSTVMSFTGSSSHPQFVGTRLGCFGADYTIYRSVPEKAKMMIELVLDKRLDHFLGGHLRGIGSHPPAVPFSYLLGMLDGQDLEHPGCDQGDVHEQLDSRHRIGDQMFAFLGQALEVFDGQRLAFELQPGRGPEVV